MEVERYISGYCRVLDSSRIVEALLVGKALTDVDCQYGSCIYQSNCPIAKELEKLQKD